MLAVKSNPDIFVRRLPLLGFLLLAGAGRLPAADKSGVSPNTISLPKGPGSIEGLGEAFQPTLNTGTAKYSVKLALPPGTAGHVPNVTLNYEGGGGNGCLGLGWSLPTAYVQRQTDKGIPRYIDGSNGMDDDADGTIDEPDEIDRFISEMKEEIVPVVMDGATVFFCKNEGAFIRYRRVGDHWEGNTPEGNTMVFGATPEARISDPEDPSRVFRWLVEEVRDTRGNSIRFSYRTFPGDENSRQRYLDRIEYGPGAAPWGGRFHFVSFRYEARSDWFEDCRSGFPVRSGRRLATISVATQGVSLSQHLEHDLNGDGIADFLNRRYDIRYRENYPWSLLDRITCTGADGETALPPTTFDYTACDESLAYSASGRMVASDNPPQLGFDSPQVDLVDLNGDALPDLLRTSPDGSPHTAILNHGEHLLDGKPLIRWGDPTPVDTPDDDRRAWQSDLASNDNHLADLDGDGLSDLVHVALGDVAFFRNLPRGTGSGPAWGGREPMAYGDFPPPSPFGSTDVRTADLDFDKRTDIVQSSPGGGLYQVWFNRGNGTYSQRVSSAPATVYEFANPGVQIADLNGDRVPDIAWVRPAEVRFTPGLGHGRFGVERSLAIPEGMTLTEAQIARAKLQDATGDGLVDLIVEQPVPSEVWFWVNGGNDLLGARRTVSGLPAALGPTVEVRWADMNGNGTTDLVYSDSVAGQPLQYLDLGALLGCSPRPHLLGAIDNGLGSVTRIEYATSTTFALADGSAADGSYTYSWPHPMPFPVDVVSGIRVSDSLGQTYVTTVRYHDGYYDSVEKQFRGFARVEQTDVGDESSPTLVTRSFFDVGDTDEALKGKVRRLTKQDEPGAIFSDEATDYRVRRLHPGLDGREVRFAHPFAQVTDILEQGRGTPRRLRLEFEYDDFGNCTAERNFGVVEDGDLSAFDDERFTLARFAENRKKWLLRFPFEEEVRDEAGTVISRRRTYYDDESFGGNNGGEITIGNATLVREWIDPAADKFIASSRTRYDAFGNPVALLDPLYGQEPGHWREIAFDSDFHCYPERETIHVSEADTLVVRAAYDFGFGTVVESRDFNGNVTTYGYDPLARLSSIVRPGDSAQFPTVEYAYVLGIPFDPGNGLPAGRISFVETRLRESAGGGQFLSREFVDGLGRVRLKKHEDEVEGKFVALEATVFNARRAPRFVSNPYQSDAFDFELPNPASPVVETRYDALLRPVMSIRQDGSFTATDYEPLAERLSDEEDTNPASPHFDTPHVHYKDGLGRLVSVDEVVKTTDEGDPGPRATWETRYAYDLNDQLVRITDSQNNVKTITFDGLKRMTGMNDPDRGLMDYVYDEASNLRETVDAKGQRIVYTYDGANRIRTEDYQNGGEREFDVEYHYDAPIPEGLRVGGTDPAVGQNMLGQIAWVRDLSGEIHFSYDARARITWEVKRIPDPGNRMLTNYRTGYEYDSADRLERLTYPDGDQIRHRYNARNLPTRLYGDAAGDIVRSIAYQPSGQLAIIAYGNGVTTAYTYDPRLRLSTLKTENRKLITPLIDFAYTFDRASNITRIDDRRDLTGQPDADARHNTQVFGYDSLYRLTRADYPGLGADAETHFIAYRYDRIGNMMSKVSDFNHVENGLPVANLGELDSGGAKGRHGRIGRTNDDPPGPHALTSVRNPQAAVPIRNYPYDANGNMTDIDGLKCEWDFKDRLVAVENDKMRAVYTYDYTDRRITKTVTGRAGVPPLPSGILPGETQTVHYINRHFEVREHCTPVKYVWNGETRVARVTRSLANPGERVQRFALQPGWNILALAVTLADGDTQLRSAPVNEVVRYAPATNDYHRIPAGQMVPAGTLIRVHATAATTLSVRGTWSPPTSVNVATGRQWLLNTQSSPLDIAAALPPNDPLWFWQADSQSWSTRVPLLPIASTHPLKLQPGEAVFTAAAAPYSLTTPDPTLDIRYYHQDHIGSSSAVSDAVGVLANETAFFPFGQPRQGYEPRGVKEYYGFTQKERDRESGLSYFESRFVSCTAARFPTVDPLVRLGTVRFKEPQEFHSYAYCANQPVNRIDPTGEYSIGAWAIGGFVLWHAWKGCKIGETINEAGNDIVSAISKECEYARLDTVMEPSNKQYRLRAEKACNSTDPQNLKTDTEKLKSAADKIKGIAQDIYIDAAAGSAGKAIPKASRSLVEKTTKHKLPSATPKSILGDPVNATAHKVGREATQQEAGGMGANLSDNINRVHENALQSPQNE